MNGMCVLPMTGRSTVGVGGERSDNRDNSDGCSTGSGGGGGGSNGAYNSDGVGGCSAGVSITRSSIRSAGGMISATDEEINTVSRKGVALDPRHPRTQGIRKLQKCLSTATSHFEVDSVSGAAAVVSQASLNYQNILTNTRQYSSFGSIIDSQL